MATREQQASSAAAKAARAAALKTLDGEPLPLPTERHTTPPEPSDALADEIVALAAVGLTENQTAYHLAMTVEEMAAMGKAHPEIDRALSRARTAALAWWEEQARRALITENNRFPAGAWAQVMKARFPEYDDKSGTTVNIDLGRFVLIDLREQPTDDRLAGDAKPLIEGATVRLEAGPTVAGSPDARFVDGPASTDSTDHDGP